MAQRSHAQLDYAKMDITHDTLCDTIKCIPGWHTAQRHKQCRTSVQVPNVCMQESRDACDTVMLEITSVLPDVLSAHHLRWWPQ